MIQSHKDIQCYQLKIDALEKEQTPKGDILIEVKSYSGKRVRVPSWPQLEQIKLELQDYEDLDSKIELALANRLSFDKVNEKTFEFYKNEHIEEDVLNLSNYSDLNDNHED